MDAIEMTVVEMLKPNPHLGRTTAHSALNQYLEALLSGSQEFFVGSAREEITSRRWQPDEDDKGLAKYLRAEARAVLLLATALREYRQDCSEPVRLSRAVVDFHQNMMAAHAERFDFASK